jgi:uncharacterized membrane protein HdeD (DUF308 family)
MGFMTPLPSYITLAMLFSVTFLITGIIEIVYAIIHRKEVDNWLWSFAGGIFDLLIGILLVSQPHLSLAFSPIYVGFGILFRSVIAIGWSIELKRQKLRDWANLLFIGILGSIFSFILLRNPLFAGMTLVIYTTLAFIVMGIFQIYLALRLRKIKTLYNNF